MRNLIFNILIALSMLGAVSCDSFLDIKPDQKLTVPESLDDLQALMDDYAMLILESIAGEISADDYIVTDSDLFSLSNDYHRRMYKWDGSELFEQSNASNDWGRFYNAIYYCNSVLEGLDKIERTRSNTIKHDQLKGRALFLRAQKLFQASLIWCSVYDHDTADEEMGMPIRLDTDFNKVSSRSTLAETYRQIIDDAQRASNLLAERVAHPIEPSRGASYALLARVHLYMGNYDKAYLYADSALSIKSDLMDYSTLNRSLIYPIPQFNAETIYYVQVGAQQILNLARLKVVEEILQTYSDKDIRKEIYFVHNSDGSHGFRGRYTGSVSLFFGYATDELYLIRAESAVRLGDIESSLADINALLITRWEKENGVSSFPPIVDTDHDVLLQTILLERRKSLLFRGLRWYDLKRLNREGANIMLRRIIDGEEFTLPPNDLRYALLIPEDIVRISDILQNPR